MSNPIATTSISNKGPEPIQLNNTHTQPNNPTNTQTNRLICCPLFIVMLMWHEKRMKDDNVNFIKLFSNESDIQRQDTSQDKQEKLDELNKFTQECLKMRFVNLITN